MVRTSVEPDSIVSAIRQAIWSIHREQPIWHVRTPGEILDRQLSTPSQSTTLLSRSLCWLYFRRRLDYMGFSRATIDGSLGSPRLRLYTTPSRPIRCEEISCFLVA